MCVRYLGLFLLLAWLPDFLQAELSCSLPELIDGYFVPKQEKYPDGETLTYGCETGFKPVVEGWWATSTCLNGKWSHTPQCINGRSCLPPTIPNRKSEEAQSGKSENVWYEENQTIRVTCEDGFVLSGTKTVTCQNGTWSLFPVCQRHSHACDEPDQIPHAVIISQAPKKVYAHNTELEYVCEDGYTTGQPADRGTIRCRRGTWTSGPPCSKWKKGEGPSCMLDKTGIRNPNVHSFPPVHMKEGEKKFLPCEWPDWWLRAECSGGRIQITDCCKGSSIYDVIQCSYRRTI